MKISRVEVFHVPPRWSFVRIETDDGIIGWGEVGIQAQRQAVGAAVDTLAAQLLGADPRRHQWLWQLMWRSGFYRGGPVLAAAIAGIDIALWDIAGKIRDCPVHELLGGPVRDRMPAYVWLGNSENNDPPEVVAAEAAARMSEGVRAFKLTLPSLPALGAGAAMQLAVDQMAAVRRVIGPDRDVAVDCHGRADRRQAAWLLEQMAPLSPLFVEEPVSPNDLGALADLTRRSSVPVAAGERAFDRHESWQLLQAGVSVLQPDIAQSGGISETWRICTLASLVGARVAPHCAIGPIALAASIQLGFAAPEVLVQEDPAMPQERATFDIYLADRSPVTLVQGFFERSTQPGLGIEIREDVVRDASSVVEPWMPPLWTNADGSYAEW